MVKNSPQSLSKILEEHKVVFKEELGTMKDFTAKLAVKSNAKPKFCHPRSIPFALKDLVEQEIKSLQSKGIVEQVKYGYCSTVIL